MRSRENVSRFEMVGDRSFDNEILEEIGTLREKLHFSSLWHLKMRTFLTMYHLRRYES